MTASTAPITLPGSHRAEAPIWMFHIIVAWITYALALAVWAVAVVRFELGRRHLLNLASALIIIAAAIVGVAHR